MNEQLPHLKKKGMRYEWTITVNDWSLRFEVMKKIKKIDIY